MADGGGPPSLPMADGGGPPSLLVGGVFVGRKDSTASTGVGTLGGGGFGAPEYCGSLK